MIDVEKYRVVSCEVIRVAARQLLPDLPFLRNHLELTVEIDHRTRGLVMSLRGAVLGKNDQRIDVEERWPAYWWQAVRERWFPAWWLKKHPVVYSKVSVHTDIYRVCPHLDIRAQGPHIDFMINGDK